MIPARSSDVPEDDAVPQSPAASSHESKSSLFSEEEIEKRCIGIKFGYDSLCRRTNSRTSCGTEIPVLVCTYRVL